MESFEIWWRNSLNEYNRQKNKLKIGDEIELRTDNKKEDKTAELSSTDTSLNLLHFYQNTGRTNKDVGQTGLYRILDYAENMSCFIVKPTDGRNTTAFQRLFDDYNNHNLRAIGVRVDEVIRPARQDSTNGKVLVTLDDYGLEAETQYSFFRKYPFHPEQGQHLKLYINNINREKQEITLGTIPTRYNLKLSIAPDNLGLAPGDECEVTPFGFVKGIVLVAYQGYKGNLPYLGNFSTPEQMYNLIEIGTPLTCSFARRDSEGYLYWELKEPGTEVDFKITDTTEDMIMGRVGNTPAVLPINNAKILFDAEYHYIQKKNGLRHMPVGATMKAVQIRYDKEIRKMTCSLALPADNGTGHGYRIRAVSKTPAGVIFTDSDQDVAFIRADMLCATIEEYNNLDITLLTDIPQDYKKWGDKTLKRPYANTHPNLHTSTDRCHAQVELASASGAVAVTHDGRLVHIKPENLGGKHANPDYNNFRHKMLPIPTHGRDELPIKYDAILCLDADNIGIKGSLTRITPQYIEAEVEAMKRQTFQGVVRSVESDNGHEWYLVDMGDWLGRVDSEYFSWKKTDDIQQYIRNETLLSFSVVGLYKDMPSILCLTRITDNISKVGMDTRTSYHGRIQEVVEASCLVPRQKKKNHEIMTTRFNVAGSKYVRIQLDNGYMAYAPLSSMCSTDGTLPSEGLFRFVFANFMTALIHVLPVKS